MCSGLVLDIAARVHGHQRLPGRSQHEQWANSPHCALRFSELIDAGTARVLLRIPPSCSV